MSSTASTRPAASQMLWVIGPSAATKSESSPASARQARQSATLKPSGSPVSSFSVVNGGFSRSMAMRKRSGIGSGRQREEDAPIACQLGVQAELWRGRADGDGAIALDQGDQCAKLR